MHQLFVSWLEVLVKVAHTEGGMEMLKYYLTKIAGVKPDWSMSQVVEEQIKAIANLVSGAFPMEP
jgi:hypothetical protein